MEKIQKILMITGLVMVFLVFLKSCGTATQVKTLMKENKSLNQKVDSLTNLIITEQEMINLLENTTLWKTLEVEELSDKNNMPINHYKNEVKR
jgi:PBP1b-binding outer membrane lipoprotein LpoB